MKLFGTKSKRDLRSGFTLLEVIFAAAIFTIGLVGVLTLFAHAARVMKASDDEIIARQKAREAMESIVGARNSTSQSWAAINNSPSGIFVSGETPLRMPGGDGIVNTGDDLSTIEYITLPAGGTRTLTGFTRQVEIVPAVGPSGVIEGLRQVTVTIRYKTGTATRSYRTVGFISRWN